MGDHEALLNVCQHRLISSIEIPIYLQIQNASCGKTRLCYKDHNKVLEIVFLEDFS